MIYETFSEINEIYAIRISMIMCMNTWKTVSIGKICWKRWFKIWKVFALHTSQDASWMSGNVWKNNHENL